MRTITSISLLLIYSSRLSTDSGDINIKSTLGNVTLKAAELDSGNDINLGAALAGGEADDVNLGSALGGTAAANNILPVLVVGLALASFTNSALDIGLAYQEGGRDAALKQAGFEVVINAAGGIVLKYVGKAVTSLTESAFKALGKEDILILAVKQIDLGSAKITEIFNKKILSKSDDNIIAALDQAQATQIAKTSSAGLISAKDANKINHVFGSKNLSKHKLESLLDDFDGDQIKAYTALKSKTQDLANKGVIKDVFESSININGKSVIVRGRVINGKVDLSTAFIE